MKETQRVREGAVSKKRVRVIEKGKRMRVKEGTNEWYDTGFGMMSYYDSLCDEKLSLSLSLSLLLPCVFLRVKNRCSEASSLFAHSTPF